jgi:hypothetical protein
VPFIASLLSIAAKRGVPGGQDIARAVWIRLDEDLQTVTAPADIWDKYIAVIFPLSKAHQH